jgi:hypothetical protein
MRTDADIKWVFNAEPVCRLTGKEFAKSEIDLLTQVDEFFKSIGRTVEREGFGIVELNKRSVKNSIGHGIGRAKAAAFKAVPEIIKYGKIIDYQKNWKSRGYSTYVIDAPIKIGVEDYIAEVIIEQSKNKKNKFYLHEVEKKEKAQSAFKTATERSAPQAFMDETQSAFKTGMVTSAPQVSQLIIAKKIAEVKGKSLIITDKNG